MAKYKSIRNTLGKKFIFALVIPFYLTITVSIIYMAMYMVGELSRDQQELMAYGEAVFAYEAATATKVLIDELNVVESGYIADADVEAYLNESLEHNTLLKEILILDPKGIVKYSTKGQSGVRGFDYSYKFSFLNSITNQVIWSPAILSKEGGSVSFDVSYKGESGSVILAKFVPNEFQVLVSDMARESSRDVAITNEEGIFVAHSDIEYVLNRSRELHMEEFIERENRTTTLQYNGELTVVTIQKTGAHDLYIITYTSFARQYYPLILLAAVSLILVGLSTYFTIRYLRKHTMNMVDSVSDLVDLTGEVSAGNYGFQIKTNTYEELEMLRTHFNEMSKVIEENFKKLSDNSVELERLNEDLMYQNMKIRENEEQIERILSSTYDGILLVDLKGKILRANSAVWELFEVPFDSVESSDYCHELFEHIPAVCEANSSEAVGRTGINRHRLIEFKLKQIEEVTSALYEEGKLVGQVKTYRDITSRVELEKKVNRATKMEAIGRLTSGIAHDFNNILQVIVGYAELVHYQLEKDDTEEELLNKVTSISDAALRAEKLIRKLMTFSRMDRVSKKPININECVEDISLMLRRVIGENIELELDLDVDLQEVMADKTQMEQIIVNLCVNSKDAIEGHGLIKIKTYETLRRSGRFICLEISDSGNGMTDEVQEKIFEPFFTTKDIGKGTGLGLATVLGIVESHGGIIELDTEPALGTTFKIILPNEQVMALSKESVEEKENAVDFSSLKVLLVEADKSLLGIHRNILENVGVEVSVASSVGEAIERIDSKREKIDLAVVDIIDDLKAIGDPKGRIISANPDMKVLVAAESKDLSQGHKPYTNQELVKAITNVVYS